MNLLIHVRIDGHNFSSMVDGKSYEEAERILAANLAANPRKSYWNPFNTNAENLKDIRFRNQQVADVAGRVSALSNMGNMFLYFQYLAERVHSNRAAMVTSIINRIEQTKMTYRAQIPKLKIGVSLAGASAGAICAIMVAQNIAANELQAVVLWDPAFRPDSLGLAASPAIAGLSSVLPIDKRNYYQTLGNGGEEKHLAVTGFDNVQLDSELQPGLDYDALHVRAVLMGMNKHGRDRPLVDCYKDFIRANSI